MPSPNSDIIVNVKRFIVSISDKLLALTHDVNEHTTLIQRLGLQNLSKATAEACGVSLSTVNRASRPQIPVDNKKAKIGRPKIVCDDFTISVIRRVCHQFYADNTYLTLDKLWNKCMEDENFPRVKKTVFREWMISKRGGFKCKKLFNKCVYLDRTDIVAHIEQYLRTVRKARQDGYTTFYLDQTWTSPDQKRKRSWMVKLTPSEIQEFKQGFYKGRVLQDVNGWTGGFMVKGGSGRIIINHIGSEHGLLDGAEDVFICKKDPKDYHNSMNAKHFKEWFGKVRSLVPEKSLIVLDQAPYHRKKVEETLNPRDNWKKGRIVQWLVDHNVPPPASGFEFTQLTKASLIMMSKKYRTEERFELEELIEDCGKDVKLLYLPVAHCELNPIENVWAYVKNRVSDINTGGTQNVLQLTKEALGEVTAKLWKNCLKEAIEFEDKYWERDRLIEQNIERIVSNPNLVIEFSDDESTSEDDDSSDTDSHTEN